MNPVEIIFALLFLGGGIALIIISVRKLMKQKRAANAKKEADHEKYGHIFHGIYKHVEGLPLAHGVMIELFYGNGKITFRKDKQEICLSCDKVLGIDICTGKDVKSQTMRGAAAGKYLIGGLGGAAIGAILATSMYFIITYKKEHETKFIMLDTAQSGTLSSKIIKDFKANYSREEKIEL